MLSRLQTTPLFAKRDIAQLRRHRLIPNPPISLRRRWVSSQASNDVPRLTHIDASGRPSMVNVGEKSPTKRAATASGRIYIPAVAYDLVSQGQPDSQANSDSPTERAKAKARSKGDVLTVAQLAAIMGCKRTSDLIPLCHPLPISHISVELTLEKSSTLLPEQEGTPSYSIVCRATVTCEGKTGVEMEALTAVSVGLLTVWDMLKAVAGREMVIGDIVVERKEGGKSGDFARQIQRVD